MTWWNWPNRISLARILLIIPLVICLLNLNSGWTGWRLFAIVLFVSMALSDALDGYLARRLHAETLLGRFLDPVGDKLLIASTLVLLSIDATAVRGFALPNWVPVVAIAKDLLTVIGFGLVYLSTSEALVRPRFLGKSCTLVQLFLVAFCLIAPNLPPAIQLLHAPLCWLASGVAVAALADYIRLGTRFAAERSQPALGKKPHE